jgi:hypothetical protein
MSKINKRRSGFLLLHAEAELVISEAGKAASCLRCARFSDCKKTGSRSSSPACGVGGRKVKLPMRLRDRRQPGNNRVTVILTRAISSALNIFTAEPCHTPPTSLTSVIAGVEADSASAGKTRDDGRICADLKMEASEEKLCKNEDGSCAKTIDVAERVDRGGEGTI